MQGFPITLVPGAHAPRYQPADGFVGELRIERVAITEQGTQERLPIVDFVLVDPEGRRWLASTTGRLVCGVAACVRGANERNHGIKEP